MSTVFLFGAGASYGSGDVKPEPPSLGPRLYAELQKRGGIASTLPPTLAALFAGNFEEGMIEFARTRSGDLIPFMREIGDYMRGFFPGDANFYKDIASIVAGRGGVVLASLNYDCLLEESIADTDHGVVYEGRRRSARDIRVLKIHGSCTFIPQLPPDHLKGMRLEGGIPGETVMSIIRAPVRPVLSEHELDQFYGPTRYVPPAISMYAPGKRFVLSSDFVENQQAQWKAEVERASRIFVIGVAVNPRDAHIWNPLARSKAWLSYVGQPADDKPFEDWRRDAKRKNAAVLAHGFAAAIPEIRRLMRR